MTKQSTKFRGWGLIIENYYYIPILKLVLFSLCKYDGFGT